MTDALTWFAEFQSIAYGGDRSWGSDGVDGEPATAAALAAEPAAAGVPDHDRAGDDLHRTSLEVIGRHFGLTLPRAQVREAALPAVLLEFG
ncbi:hypothetical protein ACIQOW_29845 [Kitasatospora sp. NPDC091335]|uniref:hypothetical protein n=1 Tax=Kitasatospora sp. NPDC091335 TaxID=3364085 RepID=UPI003800C0F0